MATQHVEWTAPGRKKPIAYSTKVTSDLIGVLSKDNPSATISEIQGKINYDEDAKKVLQQYIDSGYGDQVASEWFTRKKRNNVETKENDNGRKEGEDRVLQTGRDYQSDASRRSGSNDGESGKGSQREYSKQVDSGLAKLGFTRDDIVETKSPVNLYIQLTKDQYGFLDVVTINEAKWTSKLNQGL